MGHRSSRTNGPSNAQGDAANQTKSKHGLHSNLGSWWVRALAIGWLIVPTVQYVISDQRMRILTGRNAPLAQLVLTDFTVAYLVLLVATLILATVGALRSGDKVQQR